VCDQEKMFHFWFNTFFVKDEETTTLEECATEVFGDGVCPAATKMSVTRTQSDQTRVIDRIFAEQCRLHKQLNTELLRKARRIESSDHVNLPKADLSRPRSPAAAAFYVRQMSQRQSHTYRVLRLAKSDIDRANKDKQHRLYPHDFAVIGSV